MKFTQKNLEQFSKQIILKNIGINGQKKIFSSKILIVGAGGLGCPLILYLASSGVGNIGVVDYDKIETTNLNRQILFTSEDVGKYKVDQVKKIVKNINKKIIIKTFKTKIKKDNIGNILKNFDIICDGTDNFDSRYLINDYCLKYKKYLYQRLLISLMARFLILILKKKYPVLDVLCQKNQIMKSIVTLMEFYLL
ncbi:ThiF family adenylyltransferase [Pelagibacteraceae bacterium]|nr:ThiF family adenylyltransferase [Pelagibacteraceae bacterium]